jgi:hypothetical protein
LGDGRRVDPRRQPRSSPGALIARFASGRRRSEVSGGPESMDPPDAVEISRRRRRRGSRRAPSAGSAGSFGAS